MKRSELVTDKICTAAQLQRMILQWRLKGKSVVFTNGVFDILHSGHIYSLSQAAKEGDYLVVAVNADASVKRLKGDTRPLNDQDARALLLASLLIVDAVVIFEEDTPLELVKLLMPDVLVKGGDYSIEAIAGAREVIAAGGRVVINPLLEGFSTTALIEKSKKG